MGFSIGGFDPQKAFKTLVTGAEQALGGAVNKLEQTVAPAIQQVPGASQAFDLFESGVNALSQKLHLPGASSQDTRFDGQFLDVSDPKNPRPVSPSTPLDQVPAVLPNNGRKVEDTAVFVNGVGATAQDEARELQALANTGLKVIGLHNATQGAVSDVVQSVGDQLGLGDNKAADSVAKLIVDKVTHGESLHLVGHSQGGLVIQRGVEQATQQLEAQGYSDAQVQQLLGNVKIEDFGSAANNEPPGPKYVHYVADGDAVPNSFGEGAPGAGEGKGAKLHRIPWRSGTENPVDNHDFNSFYLSYRRPFDQAYADTGNYTTPYQPPANAYESKVGALRFLRG